ncbi:MAG: DUF4292 domain-containing protein [Ignavibacteriaceae bacterium]|nr:DUF4292 domain-containing protein [Ignavibacteriaceae bacterium]
MRSLYVLLLIITGAASVVFFNGCASTPSTERAEILSPERLVNRMEANRRKIKNFQGSGTLSVKTPSFSNSASFTVTMIKPDSINLQIRGPFGIELANILVTKNDFHFYEALNNTVYRGKLNEDILREIFKVNLSFSDLIDAFTGAVNLTNKLYREPSDFQVLYDRYFMAYADSANRTKSAFYINISDLAITEYRVTDFRNNPYFESFYSSFNVLEGLPVPYQIKTENKSEKQLLTIEYKDIKTNIANLNIIFDVPEDADIQEW